MGDRYSAYGLLFESQLPLPEFTAVADAHDRPDVQIQIGPVPEHLDTPVGRGVLFEANPREFLLRMPDIANYIVRDGAEITIEPTGTASDHEVRVFMLGSVVGALLHQRELLVLHAAAIRTDHGAVLFAGPSGIGKSTLLGELLSRGYEIIVDDVCAITTDVDDELLVLPGYPRTRLWADAARQLDIDPKQLQPTRPTLEKYEHHVPDSFLNEPARFHRFYSLRSHNETTIEVAQLSAVDSFATVVHNTYRRKFVEGLEMSTSHFALASRVASEVPIAKVTRPDVGFRLQELADAIEADLAP